MPHAKPEPKPHPGLERLRRMREAGDVEPLEPGDAEAIAEGRASAARGEGMTTDELLAYLARCDAGLEPEGEDEEEDDEDSERRG